MDSLQLRLVTPDEQAWEPDSPDLVVLVNGRDLIELVREVELPFARAEGSPSSPEATAGCRRGSCCRPRATSSGSRYPRTATARRCRSSSAAAACRGAGRSARVDLDERTVAWRDFEQSHRRPDRGRSRGWRYDGLSFRFDRGAYEAELRRVAGEL